MSYITRFHTVNSFTNLLFWLNEKKLEDGQTVLQRLNMIYNEVRGCKGLGGGEWCFTTRLSLDELRALFLEALQEGALEEEVMVTTLNKRSEYSGNEYWFEYRENK